MKKNLIKFQFSKNKNINSIFRFMLSGIFLISFFYVTPMFINFAEKNFNHKEFTNNSKNLLLKKLNTNNLIEEDITGEVDEMDLLYPESLFISDWISESQPGSFFFKLGKFLFPQNLKNWIKKHFLMKRDQLD